MSATIVVGSDGSAPSRSALRWAVERATTLEMRVLLCHVLDDNKVEPEEIEATALEYLESEAILARSSAPDANVSCSVHVGRPIAVLTELARNADLLVVGTHKTGFIQGRAFGSRFAGLVSSIETPVAYIPDLTGSYRRGVVAGINLSPTGRSVTRFAAAEAARFGETLTLIGVWGAEESGPPRTELPHHRTSQAQVEDALEGAALLAARHHPHLNIRTRILRRSVADALVDASSNARLLVIGHAAAPTRAPTVHDVLLNLSSPTVVVHPDLDATPATICAQVDLDQAASPAPVRGAGAVERRESIEELHP
ncbi:MAG: hypothetical protein JWL94_1603 [Microbacteriaceae bacterium]|jgi:nucleotide-binding universal stress UspA family protein|nr:hypothetical protein [Microbacteriaceae bacterium]HEV7956688.1 universal stress protein [Marisediminicola sp.]